MPLSPTASISRLSGARDRLAGYWGWLSMRPAEGESAPEARPRQRWIEAGLLAVIVLAYAAVQWHYFTPACRETDTAGYVWLAERLALGLPVAVPDDPYRFLSHVWVQTADGLVLPKYTPGYPALMALGLRLAGPAGPYLVSPLCGALCLVGLWWLCRLWMSPWASLCATATLAFGSMYLTYTGYPLAHAANTCAVTWGMACLLRWYRRPGVALGIGAGLALGLAPAIRPTSAVLWAVPAAAAAIVCWRWWRSRPDRAAFPWPGLVALVLAGAVFPVLLLIWNRQVFGSPWLTGYGLSDEQYAFTLGAWPAIVRQFRGILANGPAVVAGIGLLAAVVWPDRGERTLLLLWLLPLPCVYGLYYWSGSNHGTMVTRFLFCLFPLLVATAFGGLERLLRDGWQRLAVAGIMTLIAIGMDAPEAWQRLRGTVAGAEQRQQLAATKAILPELRRGAVVIAAAPLIYHLAPGHDLQLYQRDVFEPGAVLRELQNQRPNDPRQQPSRRQAIRDFYSKYQDDLPRLQREFVEAQLAAGRQVVFALPEPQLGREQKRLGDALVLATLVQWVQPRSRWQPDGQGNWHVVPWEEPWGLYEARLTGPQGDRPMPEAL